MEDAMVFILLLLCHLIDHYWQDSISLLHSFILWELTIMDGVITPIWRHACINFITSLLLIEGADYLMLDGVITPIWRHACIYITSLLFIVGADYLMLDGVITPIWRHACINFITSFLLIVGADYLMLDGVITPIWRRTCMHCYGICACHDTYLTRVFTFWSWEYVVFQIKRNLNISACLYVMQFC